MFNPYLLALALSALAYLALAPWWRRRFDLLAPRRRRRAVPPPRHTATNDKNPDWVVDEVIRLKAYLPRAGSITLAHTFNRLHGAAKNMTASKSYAAYTVHANLLAIVRLRREGKHAAPRAVARNAVWGIDMTGKTYSSSKRQAAYDLRRHRPQHPPHCVAARAGQHIVLAPAWTPVLGDRQL